MRLLRRLLPVLLLLALPSCGAARSRGAPELRTTLRVENLGFLDMNIYALRGSQRIRLGTVPGVSTRILVIPGDLIVGSRVLRFLADPIGSRVTPVSEELTVNPGEEVQLIIGQ